MSLSPRRAALLAYGLAAVMILSAVALESHRRRALDRQREHYALLRDGAELFAGALKTSVQNPETCAPLFAARKITPGATEAIELDYTLDPKFPGPLRADQELWAGTRVTDLTLTTPKKPDVRTKYAGRRMSRYPARLSLDLTDVAHHTRTVSNTLELFLWLDDDGQVVSCFGTNSVGTVCNMMGGFYDATAKDDALRCHQIATTTLTTDGADVNRGSCRVVSVTDGDCPKETETLRFQEKMGYRSRQRALCRVCE